MHVLRKLLALTVVAGGLLGLVGVSPASALALPPGDGTVSCAIAGKVRVARPVSQPTVAKIVVAGKIAACSYNGTPIPFVSGATRSIAVSNPAAVCEALADGSASAKTTVTVKVNGIRYASVTVNVELAVSPSSPGSLVAASGTATVNGVALSGNVVAQTDRPVFDLCNGATSLAFVGTASLSWDRP
jgi:hypothetical protein